MEGASEISPLVPATQTDTSIVKYGWQGLRSSDVTQKQQKMEERREQLLQLMAEFMDEGLDIDCCHPLIEEWMALLKERDQLLHAVIEQENRKVLEDSVQQLHWLLEQLQPNSLPPEFKQNLGLIKKDVARFFHAHQIVASKMSDSVAEATSTSAENVIYTEKEEMGLSESMKMLVLVDKSEGTEAPSGEQKETQTPMQEVLPPGEWKETQTECKQDPETEFKETQTRALETQHVSTQPEQTFTDMKETQTMNVNTLNTSTQAVEDTVNKETQSEHAADGLQLNLSTQKDVKVVSEYKETQTPVIETQHMSVQPDQNFTDMKETQTRLVETLNTSSQAVEEKHIASKHTQANHVELPAADVTEASMQTPAVHIQVTSSQTDLTPTQRKETQTSLIATNHSCMQTEEDKDPKTSKQQLEDSVVDVRKQANAEACQAKIVGQEHQSVRQKVLETNPTKSDEARSVSTDEKSRRKRNKNKKSRMN